MPSPVSATANGGSGTKQGVGVLALRTIRDTVSAYFQQQNWPYREAERDPMLYFAANGNSGTWLCRAVVDDDHGVFAFNSVLPSHVPPDRRLDVAEFIARVNPGLRMGSVNLNIDTGEVYVQTGVMVGKAELPERMVELLIQVNLKLMDDLLPVFAPLLAAKLSPLEAVRRLAVKPQMH